MKNKPIPKIPSSRFLFENWNAQFCIRYYDMCSCEPTREEIREEIIGWCPSSIIFARPRSDDEHIAIMLEDNTWCHFPKWAIKDECTDLTVFWNFEGLGDCR